MFSLEHLKSEPLAVALVIGWMLRLSGEVAMPLESEAVWLCLDTDLVPVLKIPDLKICSKRVMQTVQVKYTSSSYTEMV